MRSISAEGKRPDTLRCDSRSEVARPAAALPQAIAPPGDVWILALTPPLAHGKTCGFSRTDV